MASNRIGALYAEVILDPRGYSRGVSKVQSEQKILAAAIRDTTTPIERLQAEIDAIDGLFDKIAAKEPFEGQDVALDALINKTQMLADEMQRLEDLPAKKAEADASKAAESEHKDDLKREEELRRKQQETLDFMLAGANRRKKQAQDRADEEISTIKEIEAAQAAADSREMREADNLFKQIKSKNDWVERARKKANANRKRTEQEELAHQKRMARLQQSRSAMRLKNWTQYIGSVQGRKILFADLSKSVGSVNGGLSKMAGNMAQAVGFDPRIQGLARAFGGLGVKALAAVAAIYAIGKALFSAALAADKFDQRQIKIAAAMGGNKVRAKVLTDQMRDFAARTSYSTEQMQDFAAKMLTLGVSAGKIPDIAEKLGGIAMGDPERLKAIGKAYADVMTKGRLQAQEANQFANANVPIYQALSDIMGKSVGTVREMSERGEISAEKVNEALDRIRETTGADQAMAERSETIAGQWDEIKSSAGEIWRIVGGPVQDAIVRLLKIVNFVIKGIEYMAHAIEPFIENVGKGWGWMSQMAILANNIWMILTGQAAELQRQAKLEGELADLKKEQARAELEAQELADKRNKTFEEMQQQLADELQGYYDRHNEEERLADIQFERLLNEKDITEEQKQQLRNQREFNNRERDRMKAEKKAEEEAKKMAEDEKKEQRKIDDEYRKELEEIDKEAKRRADELDKEAERREKEAGAKMKEKQQIAETADAASGASFEAGSVEEYNMIRQMELQARRDAQQVIFEQEAAKDRRESNRILSLMLKNLQEDTQQQKDDAKWNYFGI